MISFDFDDVIIADMKRCLAIHDLSCVGKCSLTVCLPVISAAGVECSVIPNSLLSTHTGGFTGYTFLDLSEEMKKITLHLNTLEAKFDAVYTGYLGSKNQVMITLDFLKSYNKNKPLLIVDPAMADNGKLYAGFDLNFVDEMRKLVSKADISLPNITEACYLTGAEYREGLTFREIKKLVKKYSELGPEIVILTGVRRNGKIGALAYDKEKNLFEETYTPIVDGYYHGTGDLFSASFVGAYLNGLSVSESMRCAIDLTYQSIRKTDEDQLDRKYGVEFELFLNRFSNKIRRAVITKNKR